MVRLVDFPLTKILFFLLVGSIFSSAQSTSQAKSADTYEAYLEEDGNEDDTELNPLQYEKIYLDGVLAYRNAITNHIINPQEYAAISGLPVEAPTNNSPIEEFWDTTRVNAYKNYRSPEVFPLYFTETTFVSPVDHPMRITSRYGHRRRGAHKGIDIDLVTGDHVRAMLDGIVRFVGYSRGHGRTVVVRHYNGLETVYAHLSKYNVKINDKVSAGDLLGKGGATGRARGSHLHLETRYKGICIHPEYLFHFDNSNKIRSSEAWVTSSWKNPHYHSSYRPSDIIVIGSEEEAIAFKDAQPRYHSVQKGDTLYGIARTYNVKLSEILEINDLSPNSVLRIGKKIQVR